MNRQVKIVPVLNGFICHVGCQTVVFESRERMVITLQRYTEDPIAVEREFMTKSINPDLRELPLVPQPSCAADVIAQCATTPCDRQPVGESPSRLR